MSKLPVKTIDAEGQQPDRGRRRFLAYLGLAAIAAYAAPMVVQISDEAEAGSRSDGRRRRRRRGGSSRSDGRRRRSRRGDNGRRQRGTDGRRWQGDPWSGGWR